MKIATIILTYNEEMHIKRCIESAKKVSDEIFVVDCFSTDSTIEIARESDVVIMKNRWVNHATQFNWALDQISRNITWVLRLDADEVLTPELVSEINFCLPRANADVVGVFCRRSLCFQDRMIRHGGVSAAPVLRLFRLGHGYCENRWMDEHIKVNGAKMAFNGEIIDHNLNTLTWWIEKHNRYSNLEALELLNLEFKFMHGDSIACMLSRDKTRVKRWLKEKIYYVLPGGLRALIYFLYRYFIRLGFLDGRSGIVFHFMQGFWYRYLVDLKVAEVKKFMAESNSDAVLSIKQVLDINV